MIGAAVRAVAGLILVLGLVAAAVGWRLAVGPVALDLLTPTIAGALNAALDTLRVEVAGTVLVWGGFDHPLEVRLQQVRALASDGQTVAAVPELAVGFSVPALLQGRLALARITLLHPTLRIERTAAGALVFDLHQGQPTGPAREMVVAPEETAADTLAGSLEQLLSVTPDPHHPLGALTTVAVSGATLTIDDHIAGRLWTVPRAEIRAERDSAGVRLRAALEATLEGRRTTLELEARQRRDDGHGEVRLRFAELEPATLAPLDPRLAPLAALRLPLSGTAALGWAGRRLMPGRVRLALSAGSGTLALDPPLALSGAEFAAVLEPEEGRLTLERTTLALAETKTQLSLSGAVNGLFASPDGRLQLELRQGTQQTLLELRAIPWPGGGATGPAAIGLSLRNLDPALLAGLSPALAPLAALTLPVGGSAELTFDPGWQPVRLGLDLSAAKGRLTLPALLPAPLPLRAMALRATIERPFDPLPAGLALKSFTVDFGGPVVSVGGSVERLGERVAVKGEVKAHAVPIEALQRLWPPMLGRNARDWIVTNLSVGTVDDAWLRVDGTAPLGDPEDFIATTLDGGLNVSNATVKYFKTLPPVIGVSGHATTDGRSLIINTSGGRLLDMSAGNGRVEISKLDTPQEWIDIEMPVAGSVRAVLQVLDTPPFGYARKLGLDPLRAEGSHNSRLHFYLPLIKELELDDIDMGAVSVLKGVGLPGVAGGVNASDGDLKLVLDGKGMNISGSARLEGLPVRLDWREAFADNANPRSRIALKSEIAVAELAKRGILLAPYAEGSTAADLVLTVDGAKRTMVAGSLNLAQTRLAVPELGWSKAAGTPGLARFSAEMPKDRPLRLASFAIEGGGLRASGSAELAENNAGLALLTLNEFRAGATNLHGTLRHTPAAGWQAALQGPSLDARALFQEADEATKARSRAERLAKRGKPPKAGPRWELSAAIDRLITGEGARAFTKLNARVAHDGLGIDSAEIDAGIGSGTLALRYRPQGEQRQLLARTDDAGALLAALDVTDTVRGGQVTLTGRGDHSRPERPLEGRFDATEFRMIGAPLLARILNALSVTGLIELLQGEGLAFSALAGEFRYADDRLELRDLRTSGAALGLTLGGSVDLAADTLNLEGTIVPIYSLNRIVGMIPLLGNLISGGEGQGLFAATYYLRGPAADPDVMVNPLAVLAPGFLRNLFFLGGSGPGRE